jgi:XRE family aerobic/anaerobic benzoate catabolism transcriptional regulator
MAKDICAATGERIRKLRRAKGWRQIDLAEHSGVHEVHISDLERGAPASQACGHSARL